MTAFKGLGTYGDAVGVVTPLDHKLAQAAQVTKTTTPLVVRSGLFYAGATTIVSGTAGMSYSVAAYQLVTQRSAGAGVVFGGNDGTLSVATTAAPGSNSRIDVVYHWHREFALDGVNSNPVIGVVQGTAAASPTVPSLASFPGAIELARITVPAGVTATNSGTTITQTAPFTTADGGRVPFRSTTEMNLWLVATTNQLAWSIATGAIYRWDGTAWVHTSPYLDMTATANYAVTATKQVIATWTTEEARVGLPAISAGVFTATVAGRYAVSAFGTFSTGSGVACYLDVRKNGSQVLSANSDGSSSSIGSFANASSEVNLSVGDTLSVFAARTAGSMTDRRFSIRYIGPA
jgi:hypothetical protein